jgi:NADH-quinone oxidoreductase subunit C
MAKDIHSQILEAKAAGFEQLVDLTAVDYPSRVKRFEIVYLLLSISKNQRKIIKIDVAENETVPSISDIFPNANWFEREVFDMYGVEFSGHPDMRRILTDYGFVGYPQRKDFPLSGYQEVYYDEVSKKVAYKPVKLDQAFRSFDFQSPWEGAGYKLPGDEKAS